MSSGSRSDSVRCAQASAPQARYASAALAVEERRALAREGLVGGVAGASGRLDRAVVAGERLGDVALGARARL